MIILLSMTQVLGVGTVALISHAAGRNDQNDANQIFNQALLIAAAFAVLVLIAGYALTLPYLRLVAADELAVVQGREYLYWFLPGMALEFAMVALASGLVGIGIVKPPIIVGAATLLINAALAPVLIAGWGTGHSMGAAGAGLATSLAVLGGVTMLSVYCSRAEKYLTFRVEQFQLRFAVWRRLLAVGSPAGGELLLGFLFSTISFWAISGFGAQAQAGFGIGSRIMQGVMLPALAIGSVVAPIAGQNFGARNMDRVRTTFRFAVVQSMGLMFIALLLCQWQPEAMMRVFSPEPEVVRVGSLFLRTTSWSFFLAGVTFVCSGIFQALGSTTPSFLSAAARLIVYGLPTLWLTSQPNFKLEHVFYIWIVATMVQAVLSLVLLHKQMRLQLDSLVANQPA
jgi:putative MATE family efflux protein